MSILQENSFTLNSCSNSQPLWPFLNCYKDTKSKCHSLVCLISESECMPVFDFPFNQNTIYIISYAHPPPEVIEIVKMSRHGLCWETIIPCSFLYMDSVYYNGLISCDSATHCCNTVEWTEKRFNNGKYKTMHSGWHTPSGTMEMLFINITKKCANEKWVAFRWKKTHLLTFCEVRVRRLTTLS